MCTLTIVPKRSNNFVLTFNRDENPNREMLPLQERFLNGNTFYMPVDTLSGGSCIAISEHDFIVCLHNGGLKKHTRKTSYGSSRGKLVTRIAGQKNPLDFLLKVNMSAYEECTIFIISYIGKPTIHRYVWDGKSLIGKNISSGPIMYSSCTLYTPMQQQKRMLLFQKYLNKGKTPENLLKFHGLHGVKNQEDVFIKRMSIETVSTTQIIKNNEGVTIRYFDFISDTETTKELIKVQP